MLVEMARYSSSPECSIDVRPQVKRLSVTTDAKKLGFATIDCLARDLASVLEEEMGRFEIVPAPEPNAPTGEEAAQMGLALLAESGACDFKITFKHHNGDDTPVEDVLSPVELLKHVEARLPSGELHLPVTFHTLGSSAAGGPVNGGDIGFRVLSRHAPEPKLVSVRHALQNRVMQLRAARDEAKETLRLMREHKARAAANRVHGVRLPRTREHKLAVRSAEAALAQVEEVLSAMPAQTANDEQEMQFEWLPDTVRELRRSVVERLGVCSAALAELDNATEARESGKELMNDVDRSMAQLRAVRLPVTSPPLEDAASQMRRPLHSEFYHSSEMLASRRSLACAVASCAAKNALTTRKKMYLYELEAMREEEKAGKEYRRNSSLANSAFALDPSVTLQKSKAMMLLTTNETDQMMMAITPERVLAMADRLGIILEKAYMTEDAEAEFWLLWVAVEALRAPLPPLWRRRRDGSFEHSVTREYSDEHPLLPVFVEHVKHERRRKKTARPYAALERFMLFATDGGDGEGSFCFFNFATRQSLSGRKIPAEAVAEQAVRRKPPPPPVKTVDRATAASMAGRTQKGGTHAEAVAQEEARRAAEAAEIARWKPPPPLSKDALAKLRADSTGVRKAALSLRPRGLPELLVAARLLKVDLIAQPQLVWLVDLVLACDYLPSGWDTVPLEQMAALPGWGKDSDTMAQLMLRAPSKAKSSKALPPPIEVSSVEWLPPIERLWHLTATGLAPTQYSHQLCTMVTERHPLDGFVRSVMGAPQGT